MKRKTSKRQKFVQRERRIYHGNYLTVHIFPVFKKPGKRKKRVRPSTDVQARLNQKYREEKITYLINANFTQQDIEIGLGFDDEHLPQTYEEALRAMQNYVRRIKRAYKKVSLSELKYIYVIEKGEKNGRLHCHMVLSGGLDRDKLEELWGMGYAHTYRLEFDEDGLRGLAKYKVKEPETENANVEGKIRRWCASKNLKKPEIKERDGVISKRKTKEIREGYITEAEIEQFYPGYRVSAIEPFYNSYNAGEYLTIRLYKSQRRLKDKKEARTKCEYQQRARNSKA